MCRWWTAMDAGGFLGLVVLGIIIMSAQNLTE